MADGFLAPLAGSDRSVWASILYPLRSAEALAMVAIMGAIYWVFTILVPEYCLGVWDDANALGAPSMGMLIILISALPALLLLPLALIYTLQYLGRVLVSSARGETVPPRTPDRNFEGFFSGLYPWFIWLVFGAAVGLLPLLLSALFTDFAILSDPVRAAGLAMLGLPYALMALMLAFFHDHPLAATPAGVIGADAPRRFFFTRHDQGDGCSRAGRHDVCTRSEHEDGPFLALCSRHPGLLGHGGLDGHRRDANHGRSLLLASRQAQMAQSGVSLRHGLEALSSSLLHGSGNRTMNSLPCPGPSLWASTRPPWSFTSVLTSDSPMPSPVCVLVLGVARVGEHLEDPRAVCRRKCRCPCP